MNNGLLKKRKVIKEEPFGKSGSIQVNYDNGGFGIRGVPSQEPDYPMEAIKNRRGSRLADLVKETAVDSNESFKNALSPREFDFVKSFVDRSKQDQWYHDDPYSNEELGGLLRGLENDPEEAEAVYRAWVEQLE